ncbi:MAG: O-antigen ligase family protein [Thermoleophilia bacterium]
MKLQVCDDRRPKHREQLVLFGACLAILFTVFESRRSVFALGSINLTTTELAAGLFFLTAAVWAAVDRVRFFSRRALDLAVIFFLLSNFISSAFSEDRPSALKFSLRMTFAALFYVGVSRLPARARSHIIIVGAITITMLVVTLIGLMQSFITGVDWTNVLSPWQEGNFTFGDYYNVRVSATMPYPTVLSMYLEIALPLGLALGLWLIGMKESVRVSRNLWQGATITCMTAVLAVQIFTYTRSALMATTVSMLTAACLARVFGYGRRVVVYFSATIIVMALVLGASIAFSKTGSERYAIGDETRRYDAEYQLLTFPAKMTVGQEYNAVLRVVNKSDLTWRKSGSDNFMVVYRWVEYPDRQLLDEERSIVSELPYDLAPGESADIAVAFNTPRTPGRYVFVTELFKSGVGWLSRSGVTPVVVPVDFNSGGGSGFAIPEHPDSFIYVDIKQRLLSRPVLWQAAIDMWKSRPLLGIGPGQFRNEYPRYVSGIEPDDRIEANSIFLEALANTGLVGLTATVFLLVSALWYQFRLVSDRFLGRSVRLVALGLQAAMVAYIVHGVLDFFLWQNGVTFLFFAILGLTAWLVDHQRRRVI